MTDLRQAYPNGVIFALDQMRAYLQASLKRVWYPIGQTPTIRVTPQLYSVAFYGGLDVISRQEVALSLPKMTAANTVCFLKHVLDCFSGRNILILWDRASWHKSVAKQFVEDHALLDMIFFPPACPHLNPQEHVWKLAREAVGHLRDYAHIDDVHKAFQDHFDTVLFNIRWAAKFLPSAFLRS